MAQKPAGQVETQSATPVAAQVIVIGGGPAGVAAAIAAAQAGFSVEVAEPCLSLNGLGPQSIETGPLNTGALETGAIDKCCGEGLLPPALHALATLGLPASRLHAHGAAIDGICFQSPRRSATAAFAPRGTEPAVLGLGMRRLTLHRLLTERAIALGVQLTRQPARLDPETKRISVGTSEREPTWIIGADGAQSAVRKAAGLERGSDHGRIASQRFALRQHFALAPGMPIPTHVAVHWGQGAQAYVTPVGNGEDAQVGVAILSDRKLPAFAEALRWFPAVDRLLQGSVPRSSPRGAVSVHRTLHRVHAGNLALIGDASGGVDAITGDGLALAFQQAVALGAALKQGDLAAYQRQHTRLLRPARVMSRALLTMSAHPIVQQVAMLLLAKTPGLFSALLQAHTRSPQPGTTDLEEHPWLTVRTSTKSTT